MEAGSSDREQLNVKAMLDMDSNLKAWRPLVLILTTQVIIS